jgi:protein involved in polysaccharide export with SLBB domain
MLFIGLFKPLSFASLFAQSGSYQIQPEDRLRLSFWENPELNSEVTVGKDGGIDLPIIGRIKASELTLDQLRDQIISQMGLYNKLINHLSIVVIEYGRNKVFVTGQVAKSGKYSFEEIPNIWDIILEAGGPLENARLDQVNIIRGGEEGKIDVVDLNTALQTGRLNELPPIYPGDTIHLPGNTTPFESIRSGIRNKDEVYVFGAVVTPGPLNFKAELNILDAIGLAGGPVANANFKDIRYVAVFKNSTKVYQINLNLYLNKSLSTSIPNVTPGSTIYVPTKKTMSPLMTTVLTTAISTAVTAIIFVSISK